MLFSSNTFLFLFLPLTLAIYYCLPGGKLRNRLLLCASLFFYAWGEPYYVLLMIGCIVANYYFALAVDKSRKGKPFSAGVWMTLMLVFNIGTLFVFKYLGFAIRNINGIFGISLNVPQIALPIGISFFTFQAISYVVDVYRGEANVQRNLFDVGLYISLFPQLIAGPIVRYSTVAQAINKRSESWDMFASGACRFIVGLSKKVILANSLAVIADRAFDAAPYVGLTVVSAWMGAVAYTLQIYFDFSGYSDMAIGLGKLFGFTFEENFRYPYIAKSVTDFWRRWHISLSSWFRDYVYIPLGGSKTGSTRKHVRNLFIVWLLTGLWHGASWNYVAWGLLYFILLTMEKYLVNIDAITKMPLAKGAYQIFTMLCVMAGWVLFRAPGLKNGIRYGLCMLGLRHNSGMAPIDVFCIRENAILMAAAILCCLPWKDMLTDKMPTPIKRTGQFIYPAVMLVLLLVCVASLVKGTYNPFIYFNF